MNDMRGSREKRLSVSRPSAAPPRAFTEAELQTLRIVADTLIPPDGDFRSGSTLSKFDQLVTAAAAILDRHFDMLTGLLAELRATPQTEMWERLKRLEVENGEAFYVLSTLLVGAYIYSDEMKAELKYPAPHRNPPSLFDAADELSSGILDPVLERGPIYRAVE
ncbi:hypothetical protein DPM33_17710 [Mesorhizobium hawassense]|uniref:Gluconate 2-dehydrogenase subunit 3 family protein n=1 Tax=Mesorhizobium hawassense TaxID=1209954 RepID=A0A330HXI7_9HYPH|nr:hypothetical protein [Mesorhizobium hawassense]RAZ89417.1 hypothetical protein DPM33_17710 [Mesorhizobium hawassense]